MVGKVEHHCEYAERVKELEALRAELETKLNAALAQLDALTRRVLGPSSERMPSTTEELRGERKKNGQKADPEKTKEQRRKNAAERAAKTVETHETSFVPNEQRTCPHCEREAKTISTEKTSTQWDYVPGYLRRRVVHRESVACSCGLYVKMAPPPPKILGQSLYSSRFVAHLVVSKLSESLSIYRLEKRFKRYGVLMPRSTMNALFQKTGAEVRILARRVLELIVEQRVVQGDETSLPVLDEKKCRRGFIWTFSSRLMQGGEADDDDDSGGIVLVGYVYSKDRSGKTPAAVLGGTQGVLLVDGYTGYNVVTMPKGRVRAGCLAHPRRKFFDALSSAPDDARRAMELILDVYRVEHEASKRGIVRTQDHAELRRTEPRGDERL